MSAPITEYPSLAEVVREVTDDGRRIAEFYLGVADGSLEGFRDNHRMSAARRLDKIAPGLVREYLTRHYNEHVRESMRHTLFPMGTIAPLKKGQPERRGPNLFQRRLTRLVRQETGDGRNIVNFLIAVMDGALPGFKPHHRLESAAQLASYITNPTVIPAPEPDSSPRPRPESSREDAPESRIVRPELGSPELSRRVEEPAPYQIRGQCSAEQPPIHRGEAGSPVVGADPRVRPSSPSPSAPSASSAVNPPITPKELARFNFQPHHPDQYNFARDEITGALYAFDDQGPIAIDDDGEIYRISPDSIVGYERAARDASRRSSEDANPSPAPSQLETKNPKRRTRMPRKLRRQMGDARARKRREQSTHDQDDPGDPELTPAERRIRKKLEQHWHGPDPLDGEPFFHNYVPP